MPHTTFIVASERWQHVVCRLGAFALMAVLAFSLPASQAQNRSDRTTKSTRKLVRKVEPVYPQDLRRLNIGGIVKLDVQVSAKGSVEKVSVVGGNPILADSATKAVKQWQYEPADAPSTLLLNVEFNPSR